MNNFTPLFRCYSCPNFLLGETSVPKIAVHIAVFQGTGISVKLWWSVSTVSKIPFGELVVCSVDNLFTNQRERTLVIPKTPFQVPKTLFSARQTPTHYARMCFPSDLARTGDFTQGQVGFRAATVPDRAATGHLAKDGQSLPGDSPASGGNESPSWGQHPTTASNGKSLPAGRVF
jgi:hypothetical protein